MDVQIVSIPHTGTHFTRDLLKAHGVNITQFDHLDSLNFPYDTFEHIVAPVRPPRDVATSWGRRTHDYGWEDMWTKLAGVNGHFFFLEDKEKALLRLSEYVDVPLSSDWKKVNFSTAESVPFITEAQIAMAEDIYNTLRGHYG